MDSSNVPEVLQERLGAEATTGLLDLFDVTRREWTKDVMGLAVERFERRLVEEIASLRVEMARGEARLRDEITQKAGSLREEMVQQGAAFRHEMVHREELARESEALRREIAHETAMLRAEMAQQGALLRQEIGANRFELLKWSFLFWVGQVVTVVGLVGAMLRTMGPGR